MICVRVVIEVIGQIEEGGMPGAWRAGGRHHSRCHPALLEEEVVDLVVVIWLPNFNLNLILQRGIISWSGMGLRMLIF